MKKEYDIFISYRRDGGESTAKILRDKLTELGYSVFFDVESLRSGDFNTKLYAVIEECDDFIVVLSPGALDRCAQEDDWVRLEIEHAMEKEKNIIPVMLRGFSFPDRLPESIDGLRYKNGLESNYQFFDAFIGKLEEFLKSRPSRAGLGRWRKGKRRIWLAAAAVLAILLLSVPVCKSVIQKKPYPWTQEEKNLTDRFIYYVQQNLARLESAAGCIDDVYGECEAYFRIFDQSSDETVVESLQRARMQIYGMHNENAAMSEDLKEDLQGSPFSAADAEAMHACLLSFCEGALDDLYYMETIASKDFYMDLAVREDILENYRDILNERLRHAAYCANRLLLPVENGEAISAFKNDFLPELRYIPLRASEWIDDEEALISAQDSSLTAITMSEYRISLSIDDDRRELLEKNAGQVRAYMEEGMSAEEAEAAVKVGMSPADLLKQKEAGLYERLDAMETNLSEALKQFDTQPDTDDLDELWEDMMYYVDQGFYDKAITCMEMFREMMEDEDPCAGDYTDAVIRLIRNISGTGIDYGLVVVGYDPENPEGGPYEIGDIIIALNGGLCRNLEEYEEQKELLPEGEDYRVVVLRQKADGSGELEQKELLIPRESPEVQMRGISGKEY